MNVIKESYRYAKRYTPAWVTIMLLGFINVTCIVLLPQAPQLLVDRVINPALGEEAVINPDNPLTFLLNGVDGSDYLTMFLIIAATCLGIALTRYIGHYIRWNVSHAYGVRAEKKMRLAVFEKLLGQNSLVIDKYTSGDLLSVCNSDPVVIKDFYSQNFSILVDQFLVIGLSVFFLARMNWMLIICPLALASVTAFVTVKYARTLRKKYDRIRDAAASLNSTVSENINGVRIVRSFSSEAVETSKFDRVNNEYKDAYVTQAKTVASYQAIFNFMGQLINIVSLIIGVVLASKGDMSTGQFATFLAYVALINPPLITIINFMGAVQYTMICGNRMFTFLNTSNIISSPENAPQVSGRPDIELVNASVCLDDNEQIHNINIKLPYGKKLGVMGKTGAGKSVLIKTLTRLFETTGGDVYIDGVSIKNYDLESVRRTYSLVFQEVFLFSDTIASNIAFSNPDADDETIARAARLSDAEGFIERLPEKYDTVVGERGLGLSGGQKQRVSIARAFLKNAPIMLLDDCTSALDMATEGRILNNIKSEYADRTVVITSHRASSVMECDEIIFLENGRITERGTHDELMELKGRYYATYTAQAAKRKEALS